MSKGTQGRARRGKDEGAGEKVTPSAAPEAKDYKDHPETGDFKDALRPDPDVEPAEAPDPDELQPDRTENDGGVEGEDLPVVREGELWESLADQDDDASGGRRRFRVVNPDEDGKVRVENLVTRRVSHINRDRFRPPFYQRQFS